MKLVFNFLFLLFFVNLNAYEAVRIDHFHQSELAQLAKKVLIEKFQFPPGLISIHELNQKCIKDNQIILQICIDDDQEIQIKNLNDFYLRKNFKSFIEERK